jgi:hypothetical protein
MRYQSRLDRALGQGIPLRQDSAPLPLMQQESSQPSVRCVLEIRKETEKWGTKVDETRHWVKVYDCHKIPCHYVECSRCLCNLLIHVHRFWLYAVKDLPKVVRDIAHQEVFIMIDLLQDDPPIRQLVVTGSNTPFDCFFLMLSLYVQFAATLRPFPSVHANHPLAPRVLNCDAICRIVIALAKISRQGGN